MEQDHQLAITKMQQTHDERIAKMREHYVDFTHSILTLKDSTPGSTSASGSSGSNTSSATSSNSSSGGGTSTSSGSSSSGSGSSKSKQVDKQQLYSQELILMNDYYRPILNSLMLYIQHNNIIALCMQLILHNHYCMKWSGRGLGKRCCYIVLMIFIVSRSQQSARKALQQEPPSTSSSSSSQQQRRPRPPLPPDAKKRTGGRGGGHDGKKERGTSSHDSAGDQDQHDSNIDYRTATPQEVLE